VLGDSIRFPSSNIKATDDAAAVKVCRNQVVNACAFQAGKQIDLMLQKQGIQSAVATEGQVKVPLARSLGMSICGGLWHIYIVQQNSQVKLPKLHFVSPLFMNLDISKLTI
jgi:hypothetical protein